MTSMMTTGGSGGGFTGADVDGLDKVAQDCTEAAQVVDEVKAALEIIVAASFLFGPFGAAFISYLKTVVIPWLTKISEALQLFAKVLSSNSQAQREASSPTTSAPTSPTTYQTPANLPTSSTSNYPTLPTSVGSGGGGGGSTAPGTSGTSSGGSGSTVSQPPSIGSTGTGTGAGTTGTGTTTPQSGMVSEITALTGLVTAIDKLIHPSSTGTDPTGITTPTDPTGGSTGGPTTPISNDPTGGLGSTGAGTGTGAGSGIGASPDPISGMTGSGAASGSLGNLGTGMNFHQTGTLPNGDIVGRLSMPAEISPSGQITPLTHGELSGISSGGSEIIPISSTPSQLGTHALTSTTPLHDTTPAAISHGSGAGSSGGSSGGGGLSGGGGFSGGGTTAPQPITHTAADNVPTSTAHTAAATHHTATAAGHGATASAGSNHDGLYSGLGQATGIGAGAGAIAKASLSEAKQAADGALINAADLPFDAGSDAAAQGSVFSGTLR